MICKGKLHAGEGNLCQVYNVLLSLSWVLTKQSTSLEWINDWSGWHTRSRFLVSPSSFLMFQMDKRWNFGITTPNILLHTNRTAEAPNTSMKWFIMPKLKGLSKKHRRKRFVSKWQSSVCKKNQKFYFNGTLNNSYQKSHSFSFRTSPLRIPVRLL